MTENPTEPTGLVPPIEQEETPEAIPERIGPTVPAPHERSPEMHRRLRAAVEQMFEDVRNPYEAVIVAAQEARRINAQRLKARSILNQAVEQVEELVPEVPFVPRPIEDDVPEIKPTNEAVEKMACGLVQYRVSEDLLDTRNYYGEIDFDLYPERHEATGGDSEES
jgi:hypothetical protein